jgi:DNA-binding response OmpR family regulator
VTGLQVPLVQRTFRRGLNHWLEALLRSEGADPEVMRRLGEGLGRAAGSYALEELERAAQALAEAEDGEVAARGHELADRVRREMHPPDSGASRSRRPVVIVSADGRVSAPVSEVVSRYAHRVEVFDSVVAARSSVARSWPGLVVVDVDLPDDPLGWLLEVRESPEGGNLPILALARRARPDVLVLGVSEVLELPFPRARLEDAVGAYLGHEGRTVVEQTGDPVTGLPGPGLFQEAVSDQGLRHHGRRWCVALVVWRNRSALAAVDPVACDAAARAIGSALLQRFSTATLVARLDQETFGLLLPDIDQETALPWFEETLEGLRWVHPLLLELGMGAVIALAADYNQVLSTARRMHYLAEIAGQRALLTTIDDAPVHRVLLVHDSAELAGLLKSALRGTTLELVHRRAPIEGLEAAAATPFELVVVGASLPNQGGFDVLSTLRSWPSYASRPVVMLTADDRERVKAYELGADDCVAAPFTSDVLRARVRSRLAARG